MDYYKTLEVDRNASIEVIQKAYKALSLKYHPDKNPADRCEAALEKMKALNEAYAVLSNNDKRQAYDRHSNYWQVFADEGLVGLAKLWLFT